MIYVNISGGLGNQLFEYVFAREIQKKSGQKIELNLHEINNYELNRHFALNHFDLGKDVCVGEEELPWYVHRRSIRGAILRKLSPDVLKAVGLKKNSCIWYEPSYTEFEKMDYTKDIYVGGYWQSPRYSTDVIDEFVKTVRIHDKLSEEINQLKQEICNCNSVCMHIRRDDYVGSNYEVCSEEYYSRAMKCVEKDIPNVKYYIFSDDPEWARVHIQGNAEMVYVDGHEDYEDLYLMSACHHFIMSNSSYSWWAQRLGQYSGKHVYAPARWHHKWNVKDIYQDDWILIPIIKLLGE